MPLEHTGQCPRTIKGRWGHAESCQVPLYPTPHTIPLCAQGSTPQGHLWNYRTASGVLLPLTQQAVRLCRVRTSASQSVQLLSHIRLFGNPGTAHQASLSITNSRSLLKLKSIESVMPSTHLILCFPLLLLPSIFPSIRVFPNESALRIRWPKDCSFSLSICPSNEYSGLISFRIDWLDLLAVQGTLKSLPQHHNSKASVLLYQ